MPREFVHWKVVDRATELLREGGDSEIADLLNSEQALVRLGAMAPDAFYYLNFGASRAAEYSERLHGRDGEDTFVFLREAGKTLVVSEWASVRDKLSCFLLGMVSHCVTDSHFHPFIFYFTGDYYDPNLTEQRRARARHRQFETLLDAYLAGSRENISYLSGPAKFQEIGLERFLNTALSAAEFGGSWQSALTWMATLQRAFLSRSLAIFSQALEAIVPSWIAPYSALVYQESSAANDFFSKKLFYLHPVTGESLTTDVSELLESSAVEFVRLVRILSPVLTKGSASEILSVLTEVKGPSLNLGMIGVPTSEAKFYFESKLDFLFG